MDFTWPSVFKIVHILMSRISVVVVIMLASSVVDRRFKPKTKKLVIDAFPLSTKH